MCWMMAMTNFLASWYSISSVHWGLSSANSVTKKLCNRKRATCDTAMSGCWFTRPSPNRDRQKLVRFKIIHTTLHRNFSQVAVKLLLTIRAHDVCDSWCVIGIVITEFFFSWLFCRYLFSFQINCYQSWQYWIMICYHYSHRVFYTRIKYIKTYYDEHEYHAE